MIISFPHGYYSHCAATSCIVQFNAHSILLHRFPPPLIRTVSIALPPASFTEYSVSSNPMIGTVIRIIKPQYCTLMNKPSIFIEALAGSKETPDIGSPGKSMLATTDSENSGR